MNRGEYRKSVERVPLPPGFPQTLLRAAIAHRHRRARPRWAAVAVAAAALLLAGAAVAAVKLGALGREFREVGAEEVALENLQALDAAQRGDVLDIALGDAIWEGKNLYVSLEAGVPDDGNTYLLALMPPLRDGKDVHFRQNQFLYFDFPEAYALGGGGATEVSTMIELIPGEQRPFELAIEAVLLRTDRPVIGVAYQDYYDRNISEDRSHLAQSDEDKALYYFLENETKDGSRGIYLDGFAGVRAYIQAKKDAYEAANPPEQLPADPEFFFSPGYEDIVYPGDLIGPEMLAELGIGEVVDGARLTAAVAPSDGAVKVAAERTVAAKDFVAEIADFRMTHLAMEYRVVLHRDGGRTNYDALLPMTVDGELLDVLANSFWGGASFWASDSSPGGGQQFEYDFHGIFPTIPDKILLVPADYAGDGEGIHYHMDAAIGLSLVEG